MLTEKLLKWGMWGYVLGFFVIVGGSLMLRDYISPATEVNRYVLIVLGLGWLWTFVVGYYVLIALRYREKIRELEKLMRIAYW